MHRQTFAQINLNAVRQNFIALDNLAPESTTVAVIKADAYGHGANQVAAALAQKTRFFAVAFMDEAIRLRYAGVDAPIVILEGVSTKDALQVCAELSFIPVLHTCQQLDWLIATAAQYRPGIWMKLDSGMHRLGLQPDELERYLTRHPFLARRGNVLCSHLACADEPATDSNLKQLNIARQLAKTYRLPLSLANSAAIQFLPDAYGSYNRAGISLYGITASAHQPPTVPLQPAMTLQAEIIAIRSIQSGDTVGYGNSWQASQTSHIATLAIGYADGYPRHASPGTPVLIGNQRAPLVGRVSMDMITVDVSHIARPDVAQMATLWGEDLPVTEIAECCQTIGYELVTRVSSRVPRRYLDANGPLSGYDQSIDCADPKTMPVIK